MKKNTGKYRFVPQNDLKLAKELLKSTWGPIKLPYVVKTPVPYVICLDEYGDDKTRRLMIKELKADVANLNKILKMLKLSKKHAAKLHFTLNSQTKAGIIVLANLAEWVEIEPLLTW